MTLLGAVLAGGQSSRFGEDKALALFEGRALTDHALAALAPMTQSQIIVGRDWPGVRSVPDHPRPGLGPLGGLAGALLHAADQGFDYVLTSGCDTLGLKANHLRALSPGPAVLAKLPVIGLWPSSLAPELVHWMSETDRHSVYAFADHVGARRVDEIDLPTNINVPADLEAFLQKRS